MLIVIRNEPAKKPRLPRLALFAHPTFPPIPGSGATAQRWSALASARPHQLLGGLGTGPFRFA
jgi:hypothetical protein